MAKLALLSVGDLEERWCYTRQGIHGLMKRPDFPAPAATVNRGRQKIWLAADIVSYETAHPEVLDESAKRFRQKGYFLTLRKAGKL